jgi:Flp pilus assembly protein TadG
MCGLLAVMRDRRGVAALEFALLAPVLVVIALSLYDVTNAVITWWQLSSAADAIARIATSFAAQPDNTNVITTTQARTASTAVYAAVPALTTAPASRYGVVISSIVMTPTVLGCTNNCSYVAHTAWSAVLQGVATARPCGTLAPAAADGQPPSTGALPPDAFTAAPLVVVDVTYNLTPVFNTLFGAGLHLMETAYMATRTGSDSAWVRLTGPAAAQAECPGYSS